MYLITFGLMTQNFSPYIRRLRVAQSKFGLRTVECQRVLHSGSYLKLYLLSRAIFPFILKHEKRQSLGTEAPVL